MYIFLTFMAIITAFMSMRNKKKLRYKNNMKLSDRLNNRFSNLHYKKDSSKYKDLQLKIRNAGINLSTETFQSIRIILPFVAILVYILFKVINYVNLYTNINELLETAKVLNDESVLNVSLNVRYTEIVFIFVIAIIIPNLILIFMARIRNKLSRRESLVLQTYAIMLLKTSQPVKQILISLYERADCFKSALETAISRFSVDPDKALEELKNSTPKNDFQNICIALQQALNSDRGLSIIYLENRRSLAREINKQIRIRSQTRSQGIGILVMMIPLLISIALVGYPWLMYTIKAISLIPK